MTEPENLVLEHLRAIRADIGKSNENIRTMRAERAAMRRVTAGVMSLQDNDHDDVASSKIGLTASSDASS